MNRTKIEWADYVFNPIEGLCPVDCKTPDGKGYCYARKMYRRFGMNPKVFLNLNELIMPFPKNPSRIFVCSTFELFHPVADKWRDEIFEVINLEPQHTFIVLTKMPENIDRPMPPNVWLGVSVTGENDFWRAKQLCGIEAKMKFVSIEPLLSDDCSGPSFTGPMLDELSWGIIGRLTGHGKTWDPSKETVSRFVRLFKTRDIPVFLKNNLREIWGKPLIQEFPK